MSILESQGISKKFAIRHQKGGYLTLRDKLQGLVSKISVEEFWALQDISFKINSGESVAIIGRNGAGKSTLLKILSRITPPTKGRAVCRGRIASLLEVGTGFHLELTGRENIFMNGSILGMKRTEIRQKFDEIVDFSGIETFLDTPLKHYSSGMQLRLAFSVAAHLEPEIMILDEVLAVGDATFQKKCFQKMETVHSSGRTILLVSHNMTQVKHLCQRGILLEKGQIKFDGKIQDTISAYLQHAVRKNFVDVDSLQRSGIKSEDFRIKYLKLPKLDEQLTIMEGDELCLEIGFEISKSIDELVLGFSLTDFFGNNLVECRSTASAKKLQASQGAYVAQVTFNPQVLSGSYNLNLGARSDKGHLEYVPGVMTIEVLPRPSGFDEWNKPNAGIILTGSSWILRKHDDKK